ncbi:hypothetical protein L4C33_19905, partial [Vibrio makurazakiensis]|uniref:hypothetical protein n=1 Tax=Vibrio makurazakiensis TaxID=2910250 RepID=UPI003D11246A
KSLIISVAAFTSLQAASADFGVNIQWDKTHSYHQPSQGEQSKFEQMIESGEIKDVFVQESYGNIQSMNFVIEADNEQQVNDKINSLPMAQNGTLEINGIEYLGDMWLNSSLSNQNYGLTFNWNQDIDSAELNRVLGVDLQRVVTLNQAGVVTSSYIKTQQDNGTIKPVYLISMLADSEENALQLSQQFEAVYQGYASVEVQYLGKKLTL